MSDFVDTSLLSQLIEYRKHLGWCYRNGLQNLYEDKDLDRLLHQRYQRLSRLKKRFLYLLCNYQYIYFCTFTLNDYYINCSERTQRDLVKNCLTSFDDKIKLILNVDYGKKTERLHFHAIVGTNICLNLSDFLKQKYPCFSHCVPIHFSSLDFTRVSKYIDKLSNHALKSSTHKRRIFYNFKGWDSFDVKGYRKYSTIKYKEELYKLETLLDKGLVTGKEIFTSNSLDI